MKPTAPDFRKHVFAWVLLSLLGMITHSFGQQYQFTTLSNPLSADSTFTGISGNNVVGNYEGSNGFYYSFLYNGTSYRNINDPSEGTQAGTAAFGIDGNNVVGTYCDTSGDFDGFMYNGSTYTNIDVPYIDGYNYLTYAYGISGSNIVGYYENQGTHGFLYNGTTYKTIDDPSGTTFPRGISGNDIVGYYTGSNGEEYGFLYDGTGYTTLNFPYAVDTIANGIDGNDIVGSFYQGTQGNGNYNGFLYEGGTYTVIDDPLGVEGTYLYGIDGNEILGDYVDASGNEYGFIASPIPEPSTSADVALSVGGLILAVKRRQSKAPLCLSVLGKAPLLGHIPPPYPLLM